VDVAVLCWRDTGQRVLVIPRAHRERQDLRGLPAKVDVGGLVLESRVVVQRHGRVQAQRAHEGLVDLEGVALPVPELEVVVLSDREIRREQERQ